MLILIYVQLALIFIALVLILRQVTQIRYGERRMTETVKDLNAEVAALTESVTQATTVGTSMETLLQGLSNQLQAAATADGVDLTNEDSELGALKSTLDSNIAAWSAAVTANTPAAPAQTTTEPTPAPAAEDPNAPQPAAAS